MNSEVKSAIIAVIGVIISVAISWIIALLNNRYNYHHLYAETVSQSRNVWLNEVREYISKMLSNARRIVYNRDFSFETLKMYDECKYQILIRLNMKEDDHKVLNDYIKNIDKFINNILNNNFDNSKYLDLEEEIVNIS